MNLQSFANARVGLWPLTSFAAARQFGRCWEISGPATMTINLERLAHLCRGVCIAAGETLWVPRVQPQGAAGS
jgi:hypothetical protein